MTNQPNMKPETAPAHDQNKPAVEAPAHDKTTPPAGDVKPAVTAPAKS